MIYYRQPFTGDYAINQRFGEKITNPAGHTGIDYLCPSGTPILASAAGQVLYAGWKNGGYGYCVFIAHADGNTTIYEHLLSSIPVTVGQRVEQGDVIGYSGSTGNSTGPHLHFEIRGKDGKAFDPMTVLHSVDDTVASHQPTAVSAPLKEPGALGEMVQVVCRDGARVFNPDWSMRDVGFPQGTELHYTGKTVKRPGFPELTYCEVYEEPRKYYVAIHDGNTQILDSE